MKLNEKLRKIRKEKNISLERLSKEIKMSKSYLWELEKGTKNPTVKTLDKLARFFGTTLDYLMDEDDNSSIDTTVEIFYRVERLSREEQEKINKLIQMLF